MTEILESTDLLERFGKLPQDRAPAWLQALRATAAERFRRLGLPGPKEEEWRFTKLEPLTQLAFERAHPDDGAQALATVEQYSFGSEAAAELVFVNGYFAPDLSRLADLPRGVQLSNFAQQLKLPDTLLERHLGHYASVERHPFSALNTALMNDGVVLYVPRNGVIERPIHLLFVTTIGDQPTATYPRILIVAEENSQCSVVESYAGTAGVYFTNALIEINAGPGAVIDHCKLQQESPDAFHLATLQAQLGRGANLISHNATLGGKLTRNDITVALAGEGAQATLNGLVIIGEDQHVDNHTLLDHAQPNCSSHEVYKHVLSDRATGVFKGKILVRPGAQKTDAKQTNKSLLLSDLAIMNAMPALEIYADDVKCTHGSTTGPVDEEMIFYLRSRGISAQAARHLLTYAFAADITRRIRVAPVRRRLEEFMAAQHDLPLDLRITDLGRHDEASR